MKKNKKIFIIAGEASGDILGAGVIQSLLSKSKNISFTGIGGEEMQKIKGFKSLFDISDISVMGMVEILKRIFLIKKRIKQTIREILKTKRVIGIIIYLSKTLKINLKKLVIFFICFFLHFINYYVFFRTQFI